MGQTPSLAELRQDMQKSAMPTVAMNIDTVAGFESMQRLAKVFASSDIVPKQYQGNLANCFIAVDMALRMNANPLMVCQNLYIVHGNPAWSAQFLIATFNKSGRFSSLRYEFQGKDGEDNWGCRAVATELATGEKLVGPLITIKMAKDSGWYSKKDKYGNETSKWQLMPEQMLRYRAAAWFVRAYAPEIAMGLQTAEEVRDTIIDITPEENNGLTIEDLRSGTVTYIEQPQRDSQELQAKDTPADDKKSADKQRAAKAATKRKSESAGESTAEAQGNTPEQPPVKTSGMAEEETFECVKEMENGQKRMVTTEDCWYCNEKEGCPNRRQ